MLDFSAEGLSLVIRWSAQAMTTAFCKEWDFVDLDAAILQRLSMVGLEQRYRKCGRIKMV